MENMINVNDLSPQLIQNLLDRVELLEKTIYDLDGKALRTASVNGNAIIAKTITGDKITGGTIIGTLLQTNNSSNYMVLQDQWIDFYNNGRVMMTLGFSDGSFASPTMRFMNADGSQNSSIVANPGLGSNPSSLDITSNSGDIDISAVNANFNNTFVKIGGEEVATQPWVESYVAAHAYVPPAP